MQYFPTKNIIKLLNSRKLFHGTYTVLPENEEKFRHKFGRVASRWNPEDCLAPFGGLYITTDLHHAFSYADSIVETINYFAEYVQPQVLVLTLKSGVQIALDEDEFGWPDLCAKGGSLVDLRLPPTLKPLAIRTDWIEDFALMEMELEAANASEEFNTDLPIIKKWVDLWTKKYCEEVIVAASGALSLRILNDKFELRPF